MLERRILTSLVAGLLIVGGLAACGDDDEESGDDSTQGDQTDGQGSGAEDQVADYCDAIDEWIQGAEANPSTSTNPNLATDYNELLDEGDSLAAALPADAGQQVTQCQQEAVGVMQGILNQAAGGAGGGAEIPGFAP